LQQFKIETKLETSDLEEVINAFDVSLFKALRPPMVSLEVERFDGCETGHEVHLKLGPLKNKWVSLITSHEKSEKHFQFVDEGKKLPFPLSYWHHTHLIELRGENVWIIDSIKFETKPAFLAILMQKILFWQFSQRTPIYQKYFRNK
jgi:ligand-binding SRPBCC domain-containing protein